MTPFLTEFAASPTDVDWLRARRAEALERARATGWPSPDEEDWRHSRIADLDLGRFAPAEGPSPESEEEKAANSPVMGAIGHFSQLVVTYDGYAVHREGERAPGLEIIDLGEAAEEAGSLGEPGRELFGDLNTAAAPHPVLVRTAPGAQIQDPVVIAHWLGQEAASAWPRTIVEAGDGSSLSVVELWFSADVESLLVPRTEISGGRDAVVRHVVISDLGPRAWQLANLSARAGVGGEVTSATVALGGAYCRFRIDAELLHDAGDVRLLAAYFGDGHQVHDFRTVQSHTAEKTSSDLTFKGAVSGSARSVYSGVIRVNPGARGTSAFLTNRNLVLSDEAKAYSVPNLEIISENDLRSCGHAATSGPLDPDQVFYLESRGVPTDVARRLIVLGFFDEVVSKVPVPGLREVVRQRVGARLSSTEGIA